MAQAVDLELIGRDGANLQSVGLSHRKVTLMQTWLTTRYDHTTEEWDVARVTTEEGRLAQVDIIMSGYKTESEAADFMQKFAEIDRLAKASPAS